jgi:hypothetical protein
MKKILFAFVAGCIPALAAINGAYAQNSSTSKENIHFNRSAAFENVSMAAPGVINARAIKHLSQSYKNAAGVVWITINDGFRASFILDGVSNKVYYNKKGKWTAHLKNYTENKLPFDVRDMVKRAYYDFSINYVDEIETLQSGGIPTYIVHLESKDDYKLVRVCNGEMAVWKAFKKQQP